MHSFALVVWIIAALMLLVVSVAVVAHWIRHPQIARNHAQNANMAQFYGAPPMALMTVGGGALLVGKSLIGIHAAVDLDWVLWSAGTLAGLSTAVYIPYLLFTQHEVRPDAAFGGWLMPAIPPMVAAASLIIITMIWSRLAHHGSSGTTRVPTLWIVLGPLGQSMTAAALLGANAHLAVAPVLASSMNTFAVLYGVPVFGFAFLWAGLAASLTIRTIRRGLPFALTWWSFTFPVGTCVTGITGLSIHTGLPAFRWAAGIAYAGLLTAWLTVGIRTVRGSLSGDLLLAPTTSGPPIAIKG